MSKEFYSGMASDKITSIYRRVLRWSDTAVVARDTAKRGSLQAAMLAGKVKAYTEIMVFIGKKFPQNLEPELWENRPWKDKGKIKYTIHDHLVPPYQSNESKN